jgi:hypothetical protein
MEAMGEGLVIPEELWPEATRQQLARMELDPWEDVLANKLAELIDEGRDRNGNFSSAADNHGNPQWRVSTNYLLSSILFIPRDRQTSNHTKRLAAVMRNLGWTRTDKVMRIGETVCRGFTKPLADGGVTVAPAENAVVPLSERRFGSLRVVEDLKTNEKRVTGVTRQYRRY